MANLLVAGSSAVRLWLFLLVRQVRKGQWLMFVLAVSWPAAGIILSLPFYMWAPHIVLIVVGLFVGMLLDKPFYQRQMPALWKHLPASDAELDKIITTHELQRMNDDMGEPYW